MDYKILVKIYIPEMEENYEMYIPINKTVSQVLILVNQLINNITTGVYPIKQCIKLYNRRTFEEYRYDSVIRNTNIRNGTELVIR